MAVRPGTLATFAGSMAQAIEAELDAMLIADMGKGLPMDNSPETRDRRRFFVAVARGVMRHLEQRQGGIDIPYTADGDNRVAHPDFDVDWS